MKIEKAIKLLHPDTSADEIAEIKYKYGFRGEEQAIHKINKACKIACNAMEKQIPRKPILDKEQTMRFVTTYTCPKCGKGFTGTRVCSYCYHCGQALDWRKEE